MSIVSELRKALAELRAETQPMPGYGYLYWHPEKKEVFFSLGDSDEGEKYDVWKARLGKIDGVSKVDGDAESRPSNSEEWTVIREGLGPFELQVEALSEPFVDRSYLSKQ